MENYEIISFDTHIPLQCQMQKIGLLPTHQHDYFEINLILSGTCHVTIDNNQYILKQDDVFSVNPHTKHQMRGNECVFVSISFDQSFFVKSLPNPLKPQFECNSSVQGDNQAFDTIKTIIAHLIKNNADEQSGYELRNLSLVYQLMDVLYENFKVERSIAQDAKSHRYANRISEIAEIVKEHYSENFSLSQLADMVHLSAPYLSKFFDQQLGMTFLAYLTKYRLDHAVNELVTTNKIIEEISADSGFPNSHAFVLAFKKEYGVLPSIYRRQVHADKESSKNKTPTVDQHDYMAGLKKYLTSDKHMPETIQGTSCNITLNNDEKEFPLSHNWKNVMTVGCAADLMISDIQNMIRRTQSEIGFKYIRFSGIFSDDIRICSRDISGNIVCNFAYVDKIFDFLISVKLKPFVHLSYMPHALAKNPDRILFNSIMSEPKSIDEWSFLVESLIRHLIHRYGLSEVSSWFFSVWNQPDTPEKLYGFGDDEKFFQFYKKTYEAVKKCSQTISFGASPTFYIVSENYENWYLKYIDWCKKNSCMPEFLNFTYYDTTIFTEENASKKAFGFVDTMSLSTNPESFSDFINQVLSERNKMSISSIPIYLTEWNNTPSQQDLLNDTCFKSCYIVKNILENYDKIYSFGYWSLTDLMSEAPLPDKMFFGGLGMFTTNAIPKPVYYAMQLLSYLGDTLVSKGKGWFITKKNNDYIIILYNYRHYSALYASGERFDMTFTDRYTVFEPMQTLDVHINIDNVENTNYTVMETFLNRKSGSPFDVWVEMGAIEPESKFEIEAISNRSSLMCNKYIKSVADNTLEIDAILDTLEIRLIKISPEKSPQ